ncbi:MAG: Ig-like domain-containing protein [Nitrospirae bacterium]|nr:Ig-like domain-containing protein [Nitrospirota bacterium]
MLLRRLLILGTLLPLAACGDGFGNIDGLQACSVSTDVAEVRVYPHDPVVVPSSAPFQMTAQAYNACGDAVSGATFGWQSSDTLLATVDNQGRLRSTSPSTVGTVTVSASLSGITGQAKARSAPVAVAPGVSTVTFTGGTTSDRAVATVSVFPPQPIVAEGYRIQMTATAYNQSGQVIPEVPLSWASSHSNIASILDQSGLISGVSAGIATITVAPMGAGTANSRVAVQLIVRGVNGSSPPPPEVQMSATSATMIAGETRDLFARLKSLETGQVLPADVQWVASPAGLVTLDVDPLDSGRVTLTGVAEGRLNVTARATYLGQTYIGPAVLVTVLRYDPTVSSPWNEAKDLAGKPIMPDATAQHAMAAVGDHLFYTGGYGNGGPKEQVARAHMATNQPDIFSSDPLFRSWDRSDVSDAVNQTVLNPCTTGDQVDTWPACMAIWRLADEPGATEKAGCTDVSQLQPGAPVACISRPTITGLPNRHDYYVRYQVHGHAMVGTDTHLYVVGGIDAQIDTGITGVADINGGSATANGNTLTRFSERTLIARVDPANGGVDGWVEGPPLPSVSLAPSGGATMVDVPGAYRPAMVRYGNWLYVLGGWGWAERNGQKVGRNREEIFRAEILPDGRLTGWSQMPLPLPSPRNKHAAAVVGNRLVISGGSAGADEFAADQVLDEVWYVTLNPATGDFAIDWMAGPPLPRALEFHAMVNIPGDDRLIVVGGDDMVSGNREVYYLGINPSTGGFGDWGRLPLFPNNAVDGITAMAAVGVGSVGGLPAKRLYVSGGGELVAGSDFLLRRVGRVYYIDLR